MKACTYARYIKQSENSIEDQVRVYERLAHQHGFELVAGFTDAAVSGGTATRAGYQEMLDAARRGEFDVIVAEDTSRLWRNMAEQAPRLAELADLNIHIVTHDLDTRQESAAILGAVLGASSEAYRREIGPRTRRGVEGRARNRKPTGGRAYGYFAAADTESGDREINPEHAEVVRRIFTMYADGMSPRSIAATLNSEGIPSPGASWNRISRRKKGWMMSVIAGDPTRGTGILNNDMYIGRIVWNRSRWVRSAADSSKRKCIQNPESEWIVHEDERLRIVPQPLWDAAKVRQREQAETIGERVKRGLSRSAAKHVGRGPSSCSPGF
jgi:DNA invertase Pin-like site-specific DNA recombinase